MSSLLEKSSSDAGEEEEEEVVEDEEAELESEDGTPVKDDYIVVFK